MSAPGGERLLRLRVEDDGDLEVLSACLFEALAPVAGMRHDSEARGFALAMERFTWEEAQGEDSRLRQVPCQLVIESVSRVRRTGFGEDASGRLLSLFALTYDDGAIVVVFAEGAAIRLDVDELRCRLEDTGSGRMPPVAPPHRRRIP